MVKDGQTTFQPVSRGAWPKVQLVRAVGWAEGHTEMGPEALMRAVHIGSAVVVTHNTVMVSVSSHTATSPDMAGPLARTSS